MTEGPEAEGQLPVSWPGALVLGLSIGFLFFREGGQADPAFRASLAGFGALLLLARGYIRGGRLSSRAVATLLLVVWAGLAIGSLAGRDLNRLATRHESRLWSHFHYYLGAKYFTELGYTGLYDQAVAVDRQNERLWEDLADLRNLDTYEREPMAYEDRVRSSAWTDARWSLFSQDVLWFQPHFELRDWKRVLRDRGYNAPPPGNSMYWLWSRIALSESNLALVGLVDPLVLLLGFVLAGWVFGPLRSLLSAAWLLLFFGNEFHVVGGPVLHDYLLALLLMACAAHRNRPMWAGCALAYATMVRVFPGFMLLGLLVWGAVRWRREKRVPRFVDRFLRGFLGTCAALFVAGCLSGRGVDAWGEWAETIETHRQDHRFGDKRIGLQHLFTHPLEEGLAGWQKKRGRREVWPRQRPLWLGAAALLLGLWLVGSWRSAGEQRDPLSAALSSLLVVFAVLVLSRYYGSVLCLFFLLGGRERDGPREAWTGASLLLVVLCFYVATPQVESKYGRWFIANLSLLGWALLMVGGWLGARWFMPRGVRATS